MSGAGAAARIKGWCPGAHRPMISGDGLVVRVRPFAGELSREQALGLCAVAQRFGNGILDLTSRANLQIRGVTPDQHIAVLEALDAIGLIDADPDVEARRNVLVAPDWRKGDLTDRLHSALLSALSRLPELPNKMGMALDTGTEARLGAGSADFRFELSVTGALLLRADGAVLGRAVTEADAMQALHDMAQWFIETGGAQAGRMARHLQAQPLPEHWRQVPPRPQGAAPQIGCAALGSVLGAAFGQIEAQALVDLLSASQATALRPLLGRRFLLVGAQVTQAAGFVTDPGDPVLHAHACPGAPSCAQASVETRSVARRLVAQGLAGLHVSGCAKGCAAPHVSKITLVGRDGAFDLVKQGAPWDEPCAKALAPDRLDDLNGLL